MEMHQRKPAKKPAGAAAGKGARKQSDYNSLEAEGKANKACGQFGMAFGMAKDAPRMG